MQVRLASITWVLALVCFNGCGAIGPGSRAKSAANATSLTQEAGGNFSINAESGSVANIAVGMTENEIRNSGWPYEVRIENQEGDDYKVYDVRLSDGVYLKCVLDLNYVLGRILISSSAVKDQHGLSVGSQLRDLKRAYPAGKFIFGDADGFYANFVTGRRLIYYFNPRDLDESCFDDQLGCKVDDAIRAKTIAIGL